MLSTTALRGIKSFHDPIKRLHLSNTSVVSRCFTNFVIPNNENKYSAIAILPSAHINKTNPLKPLNQHIRLFLTPAREQTETEATLKPSPFKSKNILTSTYRVKQESYTPGQAFNLLMKKGAKGHPIRHSEFYGLCQATQEGKPTHSKRIYRALRHFKRVSKFRIYPDGAKAAVENMMKGMVGNEDDSNKNVVGKEMVQAGLFVSDAFIKDRTGLHYSLRTDDLTQDVLKPMLQGLQQSDYYNKSDPEKLSDEAYQKHINTILNTLRKVINKLTHRATAKAYFPKRTYRLFAKKLTLKNEYLGPSHETIHYAVLIVNEVTDDLEKWALESFIHKYEKYTKRTVAKMTEEILGEARVRAAAKKEEVVEGDATDDKDEEDVAEEAVEGEKDTVTEEDKEGDTKKDET